MTVHGRRLSAIIAATAAFALGCSDQGPEIEASLYGEVRTVGDHREQSVRIVADGDTLAGTLYLPATGTELAAVAVSQGSAWTTRATWNQVSPFVEGLGVGVLSWDKRGFGESQGTFTQLADSANFAIQQVDLVAGARALLGASTIDGTRIGVLGTSQGGWIVPLAANTDRANIAFGIVMIGGVISTGQDALYDQLTGLTTCTRTSTPLADINDQVYAAGPSGFDPRPGLEELTQPTIWIYGGLDMSHSADLSTRLLGEADPQGTKPWTIVTLPNANHDLIENGAICQETGPLADVVTPLLAWKADVIDGA
ncbi:MAG: prolyl oligopeptidase family serine peptidase [Gemmatimonadota bacterium]